MSIFVGLLGGLALFLYGMQMMSAGMEAAAGNRMKKILERLTANRVLGVVAGMVITAVIQSSSATTVMVVGFVNSGMMTLRQAVWIIMGANIGTTITGQLIALDVGAIAPLIAFAGVAAIVFTKNVKIHHIGSIFAGLGILFIGMDMMGTAMKPLAENETFVNLLTKFENPILGILAGTVFTAIIQSSSASVGILQTLAMNGIVNLGSAVFVLFGQNIGTCVTALLASIGTNRNARRTTIIHITFNVIGTTIFTTLCLLTPIVSMVEGWTPTNPAAQIANMHTMFNIITTLLLIPVGGYLAKFAEWVLKDKEEAEPETSLHYIQHIANLNDENFGVTAISMEGTRKELLRMLEMAKKNVHYAYELFTDYQESTVTKIEETEEYVDFLNKEISKYISRVITHERTEDGSRVFSSYLSVCSNIERIADHAMNICGYACLVKSKNVQFSDSAKNEIAQMQKVCEDLMESLLVKTPEVIDWHAEIACAEQRIDDMTKEYRNNMYDRIKKGICQGEGSILFSEMLTDFERIGDHALNISDEMTKIRLVAHQ